MERRCLLDEINLLVEKYETLSVSGIGEDTSETQMPTVTLGQGKNQIIYIVSDSDALGIALLRFADEYSSLLKSKSKIFGLPIDYIDKKFSIMLVPRLVPESSEREDRYFYNYLRYSRNIIGIVELCENTAKTQFIESERNIRIARAICDMAQAEPISIFENASEISKICEQEFQIPYFSVGIGESGREMSAFFAYVKIRKMLFCTPMLF